MKKEFKEYNEKYFRNIQFIYDFLEKVGMKNSLEVLKNESKINYVKEYDKYFLENYTNCNSGDEVDTCDNNAAESLSNNRNGNLSDAQSDNLSDDLEIDQDFFIHTIDKMNNSVLCKAIDSFENTVKSSNSINKQLNENEKKEDVSYTPKGTFCINRDIFADYKISHTSLPGDKDVITKNEKQSDECNEDIIKDDDTNQDSKVNSCEKREEMSKPHNDNENCKIKDVCTLKKISENMKDMSTVTKRNFKFPQLGNGNIPIGIKTKLDLTRYGKSNFKVVENALKNKENIVKDKRNINIFPYNFEGENDTDLFNEKGKLCTLHSEKSIYLNGESCKSGITNGTVVKGGKDEDSWDNYFTYEREICKELKVKYMSSSTRKNEESNSDDNYIGSASNILVLKYIDIYNLDTCQNMRFENIIFFKNFFPILVLVGHADGNVKLLLILYEKSDNEKNSEECIHICKELDHLSLSSPIMYIDINYKDNIFIVSTMNGDIYICKINMNNLSILTENVELNQSIDDIKNNVKTDEKYISIVRNLTYHNKYSIKCVFNEDYSLFCSIANDKNLIIYEKIICENELSVIYEKKKVIGLPEIPTSVLWVKENNIKETIIISMLNSNNILCINSKTYNIENKIYLFDELEKYNILNLEYNKIKNILVICTDTSIIFVYSFIKKSIIRKIYGCVLNSLSFPTIEVDINGNNIYITSDDKANGTHILIFDIKSGNIIDVINNGYKIRCFQLLKSYICPFSSETNSNNIEENKKSLLILGSFDKKIHFYSN
ncbi:hypothetical protein, conserved [Plasmodium gonderi]|uniref:LisH domain-containing protein n=1 Tax=Plasmodium gonderi TaxID=77519 RepID=A0A1Y1JMU9_PLAGO|nr:hypothetical protein, conserved [Plasmodium gonderi]GAW83570.1 hypothetical protein, conserved [Plasmodium gonderi]